MVALFGIIGFKIEYLVLFNRAENCELMEVSFFGLFIVNPLSQIIIIIPAQLFPYKVIRESNIFIKDDFDCFFISS